MKPLHGVRIVSVEQFGAAPYGTMLLADLGAEVIKVENAAIGGDPARKTGPFMLGENDSEYFQACNINKKSVALDLRSDGRQGRPARPDQERRCGDQQSARRPAGEDWASTTRRWRRSIPRSSACISRPTGATTSALVARLRLPDAGRIRADVA